MSSLPCLATVKYDYTGLEESELTVKKGDKVTVEQVDVSGWCLATTPDQRSGSVPFSYLELYHTSASPTPQVPRRVTASPLPSRATPPPPKIQPDPGTRRKRSPMSAWPETVSERPHSSASVNSEDDLPPPPSSPPDEEFALPSAEEDIPPPPREPATLTPLPPDDSFPPPPPGEEDDSSDLPLSSDSEDGQKKPRPRKKMQDILKQERAEAAKEYFEKFQEPNEDVGVNDKGEFDSSKWAAEMLSHDTEIGPPPKHEDEENEEPGGLPTRASMSGKKPLRPSRRERKNKSKGGSMTLSPGDLKQLDLSSVTGDLYHPELMTPMVMNTVNTGGHNPFRKGGPRDLPPQLSTTPATVTPAPVTPPPVSSTPLAQDTPSSTTIDKQYRFGSKNSSRTNSLPSNNNNDETPVVEKRGWKYTLFGCSQDWQFCLLALCCPCVAIGKNHTLRQGRESKTNTYENTPCCLAGVFCCFGGCFYFLPCYTLTEHRKTTLTLGILPTENKEPSGWWLGCCYPCTLTLDHQELVDWNFQPKSRARPRDQVMEDGGVFGNGSSDQTDYATEMRQIKQQSRVPRKGGGGVASPSQGEVTVHWHGGSNKSGSPT